MKPRINYSLTLTEYIMLLEYQKDKVQTHSKFKNTYCHCKKIMLENYLSMCQLLYIRITSKIIKFIEDVELNVDILEDTIVYNAIFDFENMKNWFKTFTYVSLYNYPYLSKKQLILFQNIQQLTDNKFFNYLEKEFQTFIHNIYNIHTNQTQDEVLYTVLNKLYSEMFNWFEISIFNVTGLNIDCDNLKPEILSDMISNDDISEFCLQEYFENDNNTMEQKSILCKNCYNCKDNKCISHQYTKEKGDILHLFFTPEMADYKSEWFKNYINLLKKYHKYPNNISIIIDYKLIDKDYIINKKDCEYLELFNKITNNIFIMNVHDKLISENIRDKISLRIIKSHDDITNFNYNLEQNNNNITCI